MKLEQLASNLVLIMDAMLNLDGILSIHSDFNGEKQIQVRSDFFRKNFKQYEVVSRTNFDYPVEINTRLNGIKFFALVSNSEWKGLCNEMVTTIKNRKEG